MGLLPRNRILEPDVDTAGPDGMIAARFHLHALKQLLAEHRECVIDLGAGHSVLSEKALLRQAQRLLQRYPNVFLLLPSPDPAVSDSILAARNTENEWLQAFTKEKGWNPNEYFVRHPSNFALARHIIYTEGRSPEVTRDEILKLLEQRPRERGRHTRTKQKSEMRKQLAKALKETEESRMRSLALMTIRTDGESDCWARADSQDQAEICGYLSGLEKDLSC